MWQTLSNHLQKKCSLHSSKTECVTSFTRRMGEHPDLIPLLKMYRHYFLGKSPQISSLLWLPSAAVGLFCREEVHIFISDLLLAGLAVREALSCLGWKGFNDPLVQTPSLTVPCLIPSLAVILHLKRKVMDVWTSEFCEATAAVNYLHLQWGTALQLRSHWSCVSKFQSRALEWCLYP